MIGQLTGKLVYKEPPHVLLDVVGVGYELQVPMTTFYLLPEAGERTLLHTHMAVREDAHTLYGFSTRKQRDFFRLLIKVNGVGPKMGLSILSGLEVDEFASLIATGESAPLTRVPGVGKKTAERLVIEMRDKIKDFGAQIDETSTMGQPQAPQRNPADEAIAALIALGYKPNQATSVVKKVQNQADSIESMIKMALKQLLPSGS